MRTMTATDAQQSFGDLIMKAQAQPVAVTKHGKNVAIVMSDEEYQALKIQAFRAAVQEGDFSGDDGLHNMEDIKLEARKAAGLID